jgi:hypothetical protein
MEQSEDFIINVFCPLMERVATQVRGLGLDGFDPRVVNAFLRCFHRNQLTSFSIKNCHHFLECSNASEIKGTFRYLMEIDLDDCALSMETRLY